MSYAQVRALTRFVTAADEDVWPDLARHSTAVQLETSAEALPVVTADALPSRWGGEKIILGYVVNVPLQHAA